MFGIKKPAKVPNLQESVEKGLAAVRELIAPASLVITPNYLQLGNLYVRTLFVYTYPRYIATNWLSPIINFDITLDMAMHIYPMESRDVLPNLRRKASQLESSRRIEQEKGFVRNPELDAAIGDIDKLRDDVQTGQQRLFRFGLYFTIYAKTLDELTTTSQQLESTLNGMLIYTKQSLLQMEQGFNSTLPIALDEIQVNKNLDTQSLSTTFPFISSELTTNRGILYGINRHNSSLILFDRFDMENANMVVFAKSGAGKSYAVKLEALRSLMLGSDVIVVDPENEYQALAQAVGGSYFPLSLNSEKRINPFDLPPATGEETGEQILRTAISDLHGLLSIMLGGLTPEDDAILDKALYETYALRDITEDISTHKNTPPLLSDLQSVLTNMNHAEALVNKLTKYTEGTFAGLFNKPTNFQLERGFIVFSLRDLEDNLRPVGMYMILNYIWSKIRSQMRKRIMIIDEAWLLMQYPESASYVFSLAKRARKYYLGLTIISQDVEDFLGSDKGRAVINNSSMQILLKQSPNVIDQIGEVFNLTDGEKYLLLESDIGEGLFFAGSNHVAIKIIASYIEDQIITSNPQELLEQKEKEKLAQGGETTIINPTGTGVESQPEPAQAPTPKAQIPAANPAPVAPKPTQPIPQAQPSAPKPGATPQTPFAPKANPPETSKGKSTLTDYYEPQSAPQTVTNQQNPPAPAPPVPDKVNINANIQPEVDEEVKHDSIAQAREGNEKQFVPLEFAAKSRFVPKPPSAPSADFTHTSPAQFQPSQPAQAPSAPTNQIPQINPAANVKPTK